MPAMAFGFMVLILLVYARIIAPRKPYGLLALGMLVLGAQGASVFWDEPPRLLVVGAAVTAMLVALTVFFLSLREVDALKKRLAAHEAREDGNT